MSPPNQLEKLLAGKVDPNAGNPAGWTALHLAAQEGRLDAAQVTMHPEPYTLPTSSDV